MKVGRGRLLGAYRQMRTNREFEQDLYKQFSTVETSDFCHLYAGGRTSAVTIYQQLAGADHIGSTPVAMAAALPKAAIIKSTQPALLGISLMIDKAVVGDDDMVISCMPPLSHSYGHRAIDGPMAARFVTDIRRLLPQPSQLATSKFKQ